MEWLDIVDEKGNPTGQQVERKTAHAKGIRHRTSHVWLVREKNKKIEILLQKRSEKKSFPGCYDISSAGHIPAGCGFEESAIRELQEELGVTASEKELHYCGQRSIHHEEVFFGEPFVDNQISNVYYIWRDMDEGEIEIQEEELEEVRWMDFSLCLEMVRSGTIKSCIALEELKMLESELRKDR